MFIERGRSKYSPRSSGAKRPESRTITENIALRWSAGRRHHLFL